VRFFVANLISDHALFDHGFYDVVFCRNVLIYFGEGAFHATIDLFSRALKPGGHLCLGHSESLTNVRKDFLPLMFPEGVVYQKKDQA
jgi:chemotaxis protein methyltransferase CheR